MSQYLARIAVDDSWPWNVIWTDQANFHLNGLVNNHNYRIWAKEKRSRSANQILAWYISDRMMRVYCFIHYGTTFLFKQVTPKGLTT